MSFADVSVLATFLYLGVYVQATTDSPNKLNSFKLPQNNDEVLQDEFDNFWKIVPIFLSMDILEQIDITIFVQINCDIDDLYVDRSTVEEQMKKVFLSKNRESRVFDDLSEGIFGSMFNKDGVINNEGLKTVYTIAQI